MYQTINENNTFVVIEKKSRFIANLIYVENKLEAEAKIKEIKKKYHDARHNCFAFRVLEEDIIYEKSSDDGEPSGTAGSPILNILKKNKLCNVLVVVTRYFGGILLGTGGLARAYSGAASGVVEKSCKIFIESGYQFKVQIDYSNFQHFQYYCNKKNIKIIKIGYEEYINCWVEMINNIRKQFLDDIAKKSINVLKVDEVCNKYVRI